MKRKSIKNVIRSKIVFHEDTCAKYVHERHVYCLSTQQKDKSLDEDTGQTLNSEKCPAFFGGNNEGQHFHKVGKFLIQSEHINR